jgi:site-specific DNA recombinase
MVPHNLGVIHCGECDRSAYKLKGGKGRKSRYRCASAQYKNPCFNRSIPVEWAEDELERRILANLGPLERRQRVWFAGNDHTDELTELNNTLSDLAEQLGTRAFRRGTPQRARLDSRIAALSARQAELSSTPSEPAGWRYEPTGELFSDWWEASDNQARNVWLRQSGFRVVWSSHSEGTRTVVDEFRLGGDLTMDLDADQVFGPMVVLVTMLSDPSVMKDLPVGE